jgi:hypothetical protein
LSLVAFHAATLRSSCTACRKKEQAARQAVARADAARRQAEAVEAKFNDKIDRLKAEFASMAPAQAKAA